MEITKELIETYEKKKAEVDVLSDNELIELINYGRNNSNLIFGVDQFKYAYALLKKDYLDEAYKYINDYFIQFASMVNAKGDNIFLSELGDFISGMLCCECCTNCCEGGCGDDCNCCSCCGIFVILVICIKCCGCNGGTSCIKWLWNDLCVGFCCGSIDDCCCQPCWGTFGC